MSPVRPRSPVVITCQPSDDHNYSISRLPDQEVPGSSDSSIDEEYDFGNDESEGFSDTSDDESEVDEGPYSYSDDEARSHSPKAKRRKKESSMSPLKKRLVIAEDEDEEMKIAAGADALLNLAGIKTSNVVPLRSISPTNNNNNNNNNDKKVAMSQAWGEGKSSANMWASAMGDGAAGGRQNRGPPNLWHRDTTTDSQTTPANRGTDNTFVTKEINLGLAKPPL